MEEKDPQANEGTEFTPQEQPAESTGTPQTEEMGQKLEEAQKQIEYYKDLFLRKAAEFDNFKRRAEGESLSIATYSKAELIADLLPIVDDFERSMKMSKDRRESEAFLKGIELIYQKLLKFLEAQGVRPLESLGKEFDVQYHDALLQIPRKDIPPHTVIEEVEKGYALGDRIIRHAKVVVSAMPPEDGESATGSTDQARNAASDAKKTTEN